MTTIFCVVALNAFEICAQTRAYKYTHSVCDGVKIKAVANPNAIFYFTFVEGKSKCYQSDAQGVSQSQYSGYFKYVGKENGILVYEHVKSSSFNDMGEEYLLFSEDYSRMNWRLAMDDIIAPRGSIRVLQYLANPQSANEDAPLQLY